MVEHPRGSDSREVAPLDLSRPVRTLTVKERSVEADTVSFRPMRRPPMALLCILDDGQEDGEWIRLRGERLVIGRTEGDIMVCHDDLMSGQHAEISRQVDKDRYRWFLADLGSTNGTYVRVGGGLLIDGQELLIGSRRLRFRAALQGAALMADAEKHPPGIAKGTAGWQGLSPTSLIPSFVEITPQGDGETHFLQSPENWIGRDPALCNIALLEDPMVSPRHARIFRDAKGRWRIEHAKSLNGLWLRIERVPVEGACQFQLGEQRFLLRVP